MMAGRQKISELLQHTQRFCLRDNHIYHKLTLAILLHNLKAFTQKKMPRNFLYISDLLFSDTWLLTEWLIFSQESDSRKGATARQDVVPGDARML
jgi:hypothetical protein